MERQRLINATTSLIVTVFAALTLWVFIPNFIALPTFRLGSTSTLVTPRLVPQILSITMLITSLTHLLLTLIAPSTGEARAETPAWARRDQFRSVGILVLVGSYILFAIEALGFYSTTALYLGLGFVVLGERSPARIVLTALIVPVVFYVLFERTFNLFLPRGLLF